MAEILDTPPLVRVGSDASAAIGISARLGAGRVRHLEAKELWIQEKVRAKQVSVSKIGTRDNRADMLTKFLDGAQHHALLKLLPMLWSTRRCKTGLAAVAAIILTTPAGATETEEKRDHYEAIGWTVVLLAAVSAWLAGAWRARARRPSTRTAAAQTDETPDPPVVVVPRYLRVEMISKIYLTKSCGKFHTVKACAENRSRHPIQEHERCVACVS